MRIPVYPVHPALITFRISDSTALWQLLTELWILDAINSRLQTHTININSADTVLSAVSMLVSLSYPHIFNSSSISISPITTMRVWRSRIRIDESTVLPLTLIPTTHEQTYPLMWIFALMRLVVPTPQRTRHAHSSRELHSCEYKYIDIVVFRTILTHRHVEIILEMIHWIPHNAWGIS